MSAVTKIGKVITMLLCTVCEFCRLQCGGWWVAVVVVGGGGGSDSGSLKQHTNTGIYGFHGLVG